MTAKDDKTLVVELEHPAPYMLQYLMHQAVFPVPRHTVMAKGDAWAKPENYVGNGPFLPKEWVPNDHLTLVKNPRFYDAANVRLKTIIYKPTSDTLAALKSIRAGELDTQQLIPAAEIAWMRHNIPRALQLHPTLAVSYLITNFQRKPLHDRRMREAIALAYDREILCYKILRIGDVPAYHFVPPGVANYPEGAHLDFVALTREQRLAKARALMAEMAMARTTISTRPSTPRPPPMPSAARRCCNRCCATSISTSTSSPPTDSSSTRSSRRASSTSASAAWIAISTIAGTFLDLLQSESGNNYGKYNSPKFDALLAQSYQTLDATKRGVLLRQAEQVALDDLGVIPGRFLVTQDIVEPYVKGWIPNIRDFNRTRWLWIDPNTAPERGN